MLNDFIIGYEALLFEMPADSGQGNVENVPPQHSSPSFPLWSFPIAHTVLRLQVKKQTTATNTWLHFSWILRYHFKQHKELSKYCQGNHREHSSLISFVHRFFCFVLFCSFFFLPPSLTPWAEYQPQGLVLIRPGLCHWAKPHLLATGFFNAQWIQDSLRKLLLFHLYP